MNKVNFNKNKKTLVFVIMAMMTFNSNAQVFIGINNESNKQWEEMWNSIYKQNEWFKEQKEIIESANTQLKLNIPDEIQKFLDQISKLDTYLKQNDVESACDYIDDAMLYDPSSAWMYIQYLCDEKSGLMDSAHVSSLVRCLAENFAGRRSFLGEDRLNFVLKAFVDEREYEKIIDLYEKFIDSYHWYSEYPPLLVFATNAYYNLGEWEKVIETYNKLTQLVKDDSLSYGTYYTYTFNRNDMEFMEGTAQLSQLYIYWDKAEYLKAFEVSKSLPDSIWNVEGLYLWAYFHCLVDENYERSIGIYNTIIEFEPSANTYSGRAYSYRKAGRMEEAKRDYLKVLELESDYVTWKTPEAYWFLGNESMAKKTAEKLLDSDSLTFDDYFEASLFYETIGKERKAYKLLKKSLKEEHDKSLYPLVILSFETPSLRKKVEKLLGEQ